MVDVVEGPPLTLKGGLRMALRRHECGHQWAITPIHQTLETWQPIHINLSTNSLFTLPPLY